MSLLRRLWSWAFGRSDEEERSLFDCLPIELYGEIFKHLDVENLKHCKAVCYSWAMGLLASRVLLKKSVSAWKVLNHDHETSFNENDYDCSYLCNRVRIYARNLTLVNFTQLNNFKFITYMEISKITITSNFLAALVSRMDFLISLTTTDTIFHVESEYDNPVWTNLKTLTIQIRHVRHWSDAEISEIGNYCTNLEYLNFHAYCSPRTRFSQSFRFIDFFINFLKTIRKNSNTLKSAVLDTFRIDYDREFEKYTQQDGQEQFNEDQDILFKRFLNSLEYVGRVDLSWDSSDILVKKLHLGFRLLRTGIHQAQQYFLPFLRTMKDLEEFSLSQIHFPGNGQSTIQELKDCLPVNCRTKFDGVMTIRMRDLLAPVWNPNLRRPVYHESPIHGYFDSTVALYTANHSLTLRFVCCNSLESIDFFTRNIRFLTKIKVDQSGGHLRHKIALDDGDMQRIIRLAIHLTDLCLEFCDLSAITDFGLTGISAEACMRMTLTRNFELLDGDRIGIPVCGLKNLRSLKLSTVGNQVTDVTAHHAFKGLNYLTYFGISKPQMTSNGLKEIRRLFEFNQVVQFDPYTKYQLYCIDSAGFERDPASVPEILDREGEGSIDLIS